MFCEGCFSTKWLNTSSVHAYGTCYIITTLSGLPYFVALFSSSSKKLPSLQMTMPSYFHLLKLVQHLFLQPKLVAREMQQVVLNHDLVFQYIHNQVMKPLHTTRIFGFSNQELWLKNPNLYKGQKDPLVILDKSTCLV